MEKFWAVILIFVVVAAAGLMYVNQVYNPQKDTQQTMASLVNDTLSAVEMEIGDGIKIFEAKGSQLEAKIGEYVDEDEEVDIYINGKHVNIKINQINDQDEIYDDKDYTVKIDSSGSGKTRITIREK